MKNTYTQFALRLLAVNCAALLVLAACQEAGDIQSGCAPGSTVECPCGEAEVGFQTCEDDGQSLSECRCVDAGTDRDAALPVDGNASPEDMDVVDVALPPGDAESVPDSTVDAAVVELDGENLYFAYCGSCHGPDGSGGDGGPNIRSDVERKSDRRLLETILEGEDNMPAIRVTEAEALAIIEHLRTWSEPADDEMDDDAEDAPSNDAPESP